MAGQDATTTGRCGKGTRTYLLWRGATRLVGARLWLRRFALVGSDVRAVFRGVALDVGLLRGQRRLCRVQNCGPPYEQKRRENATEWLHDD